MNVSSVDRDRQLAREAIFALVAILLAFLLLAAVVCWRFGLLSTADAEPAVPLRLADIAPEMAARLRRQEAAERDAAKRSRPARVARAVAQTPWRARPQTDEFTLPADFEASHGVESTGDAAADREFRPVLEPSASPAAAPIAEPDIASLPSPYETASEFGHPPRAFDEAPDARPLPVHETSPRCTSPLDRPPPEGDAPPAATELRDAGKNRVAASPGRRLVAPFAEDAAEQIDASLPREEDRPPTRLEAPSAYPDKPAGANTATAPSVAGPETTIVAPDDTFWSISERVYGTADYYKALYHHNRERFRRPDRLPIGAAVDTPPPAELRRLYPALAPPSLDP